MNLFIDTNVFLSFYHFTKDELEELAKLVVIARRHRLTLLIPQQVLDEFERNRAHKISEALHLLQGKDFDNQFPRLCVEYPEYEELRTLQRQYSSIKSRLVAQVREAAVARTLPADSTLADLFAVATRVPVTTEHVEAATIRRQRGNPPGRAAESTSKRRLFGDAINWEALLAFPSDDVTLHVVSEDADWASPLDPGTFDEFLQAEWQYAHPGGSVHLHARLSVFLGTHFPEIHLAEEADKEIAIDDLAASPSFKDTHRAIAVLRLFSEFTSAQVNRIARVCLENDQVRRILSDDDVRTFVEGVLNRHGAAIDDATRIALSNELAASQEDA